MHDDLSKAGIFVQYTQSPIQIDQVSPDSPAQHAGLQSGDKIVSVDGHAIPHRVAAGGLHADG